MRDSYIHRKIETEIDETDTETEGDRDRPTYRVKLTNRQIPTHSDGQAKQSELARIWYRIIL